MPWNGTGSYVLPPAFTPEVNGTVIDAVRYNGTTDDVAGGITAALAKNGENVPTANLPMGGFKHTGAAAGAATGQYLTYQQTFPFTTFQTAGEMVRLLSTGSVAAGASTFLTFRDTVGDAGYLGFNGIANRLDLMNYKTGDLTFGTSGIVRMRVDSAGNVGIGTTPLPWSATYRSIDFSGVGSVIGEPTALLLGGNYFNDGAWKLRTAGPASLVQVANGEVTIFTGATGGAGTASPPVTKMIVANTGDVTIVDGLGINGKAAVADIAAPAAATDLATAITLVNSLRLRLIAFGLYI